MYLTGRWKSRSDTVRISSLFTSFDAMVVPIPFTLDTGRLKTLLSGGDGLLELIPLVDNVENSDFCVICLGLNAADEDARGEIVALIARI